MLGFVVLQKDPVCGQRPRTIWGIGKVFFWESAGQDPLIKVGGEVFSKEVELRLDIIASCCQT